MSLTHLLDSLSLPLPAGQVMRAEEGDGEPAYWLSDDVVDSEIWGRFRAVHPKSGLWPVLVHESEEGPWTTGEVWLDRVTDPADHDPEEVLATWWNAYAKDTGWTGLAPAQQPVADPDGLADALTAKAGGDVRLVLAAAGRSADVLAASGWDGPANYDNDTAKFAAVVRSWEDRFGVRVIHFADYSTLGLAVAAPPRDQTTAELVAAEHFAFCPDQFWQGAPDETVVTYARKLIGKDYWQFWWD